jgi:hypothetical protein
VSTALIVAFINPVEILKGAWIEQSRAMGHTAAEKSLMELNARAQVTTWTPFVLTPEYGENWPRTSNIDGYAQKQWGGLSRLSHAPRLAMFVQQLTGDMGANRTTTNQSAYIQNFIDAAVVFENKEYNATELQGALVFRRTFGM